jgi:tRNA dimethylallyltransferase
MMPGLVRETRRLLEEGFGRFLTSSQAIGYAEAAASLEGALTEEEATALTIRRTKVLARRQMAWFRRDPRIRWFDAGEEGALAVEQEILTYLRGDRAETRPRTATVKG